MYRASTGDLAHYDDGPPTRGGGERWDRDRFERMRGGGGGARRGDEHDHYRFTEHERFPGGRRDIDIHEDMDRRGPRVAERERFYEDERFDRPARRRPELFDDLNPSEVANKALAPYRRKSVVEKDIDIAIRRPARPQYIRRQSSLDTFDRRPMPRYGDHERDEWRPPTNVPIPLPIRERRRSPRRFRDDDYEDIRYRDVERDREGRGRSSEEYREIEVRREKSKRRRSRSRAARSIAATSVRSSSSSSFEEVSPVRTTIGRRGKTRMPKRLVKKQAVIELGYPYEEEDDFIIVRRALEKEHIDEIIKISESYKDEKTTYVYEDKKTVIEELPPPPPPMSEIIVPAPSRAPTVVYAQSVRSASPPRHEVYEERIEESNHIGGPLTMLVPDRPRESERRVTRIERDIRSDRDIKDEIRALEAERQMLRYEREGDYEVIERGEPRRNIVRVEKDRKVRREPNPKLVAAAMATLT